MSDKHPQTACIIGGGMSGLITGALLAKNGYKVTVLEKNHIIGGGLQSFRRGDAVFNTGIQGFAGYENPYAVGQVFKYFGIDGKDVEFSAVDDNAQEIVWTNKNNCYYLPKGRMQFEQYLVAKFPHQQEGIHKLMDCIYEIGNAFDYMWLRPIQPHPELIPYTKLTAEQFIMQCVSEDELLNIFEYIGPHLGFNLSKLSSIDFILICIQYIEGRWRIVGGASMLAQALVKSIENNEGKVYNNKEVNHVHVDGKDVKYVTTKDNHTYEADVFICACSPSVLLDIIDGEVFRVSTKERIKKFTNDSSFLSIYIQLKKKKIKYCNSFILLPHPKTDEILPRMMGVVTPPFQNQKGWAKTVEILLPIHYRDFLKWENTKSGCRGDEYEQYKMNMAEEVINYVASFYPQLLQAIENVYASTPLTIKDYYGNPYGASYSQQGLYIPIKTHMNNLFNTGQSVMYQGLYGAIVTSILTVETILGRSLIEEIAKA